MKTYICKKDYKKECRETKKAIELSVKNLSDRIIAYQNQNTEFNSIFNDDYVKYDKHGEFYTFKSKKCNLQIRILYAYLIIDEEPVILIADYYIKKKNSKNYINKFDFINDIKALQLFNSDICYQI